MPDVRVATLAKELREAAVDSVWRQWAAIGGTLTTSVPARAIVDPETLLLMTLWLVEHERRLWDALWSWVKMNSALLSMQRLRNLRGEFPPIVTRHLSDLAGARVGHAKDPRWRPLQERDPGRVPARSTKARAVEPSFSSWATLMLQLRRGMGVGVKADVLTVVLGLNAVTTEWANVASIAETLGYTPAAVRRAVDDLASARFIRQLDTSVGAGGAQRMFTGQPAAWTNVLGMGPSTPGWGHWRQRFGFLIETLDWLDRSQTRRLTQYAMDVTSREILTRHALAFRHDRVIDPLAFSVAELNFDYFIEASHAFMGWLRNRA